MLLKEIAVSLVGFAITVVLAFGAPPAMAADFNVVLDTSEDIGTAAGLQLPYPANNTLGVGLRFDQAVVLETSHLQISGYDANDVYDPAVVLAARHPVFPTTADTAFWVSITVTTGTSKVKLQVNGGIPSDDASNADTSREFTADIGVLAADVAGGPRVYSIQRADGSTQPVTSGAVNVTITLSEEPASFTAAHINVTNATAGTPVALGATPQNKVDLTTLTTHLIATGAIGYRPSLRTVSQLKVEITTYMNDTAGAAPAEFIDRVRALKTAVYDIGTPWRYYFLNTDGSLAYIVLWDGTNYLPFPALINDVVPPPTTQGTANISVSTPIVWTLYTIDFDRSAPRPLKPEGGPGKTKAEADFRQAKFKAQTSSAANNQRAWYKKERLAYDRYIELQNALQAYDVRQQQEWDQELATAAASEQVVPQNSLPPTGRDGMLYRYSVTLTPSYATASPVVVKVNRFPNTDSTPVFYTPPALESGYREGFDKLTIPVTEAPVPVLPPGGGGGLAGDGIVFAPSLLTALEREQIQEQIDLLIATGDRSPDALKTLIYLQQLLATARPGKTQLLANYPNPFNPETWIPYELATDTDVRLTIYNAQGGVVRTLQLGQQSAGYYRDRERAAYWDGHNALGERVASGIYFYQLETDAMSALRKMVILK